MAINKSNPNNMSTPNGVPPYIMPAMGGYGMGAPNGQMPNDKNSSKKGKKKKKVSAEKKAMMQQRARAMRERQEFALENITYRQKVDALKDVKGTSNDYYKIAKDKKPKKQKDYFFVMRKFVCFLMFLFLLVVVAVFVLGFVNVPALSPEFTALFVETEKKAEAEAAETVEETTEEETTTKPVVKFDGTAYSALDPIFGFVKYVSGKLGTEISIGESPLFDSMMAKREMGMTDKIASTVLLVAPVFMIVYLITAVVMMLKAFFGMFNRRVYRKFGLGGIVMIICAAVTLLSGLAYMTDLNASMSFGAITEILLNHLTKVGGFAAGYGLLALLALPLLVVILSIFCKKKIPYSIFDR